MAHELLIESGKAAMMYVGETPWHGLGQMLKEPPTAAEAIKAAQLDWRVVKKPVYAVDAGQWYAIPDSYAVVREDLWGKENCPVFATVSKNYEPLQNSEAFGFFDDLIGRKVATYETAGALGEGERVWVMAKLKNPITIAKSDELQPYILLANGHNAATAVRIMLTPVRVVCQNTLNCALGHSNNEFRVHHGPAMHKKLDLARQQLDELLRQYEKLAASFGKMARHSMVKNAVPSYLEVVFPVPEKGTRTDRNYEKLVSEINGKRDRCTELFEHGKGNAEPGVCGSLWAAYNGVTEWTDHQMPFSNRYQRFNSLFFGEASRVKARALSHALELIGDADSAASLETSGLN